MATVQSVPKFNSFLTQVRDRRLLTVRLQDEGFVEPKRLGGGAIVMQPMVRVVATAYDPAQDEILKWEEKGEARQMVTINAGTGRGWHNDANVSARRQQLHDILVMENLQVEPGEWTPESIASLQAARRRFG